MVKCGSMFSRSVLLAVCVLLALCVGLLMLPSVLTWAQQAVVVQDNCLTFLSTDKPIYRLGETVYMRAVLLNAEDRTPTKNRLNGVIKIMGPKGDMITQMGMNVQDSVGGVSWVVPEGSAGGEYKVVVEYPMNGYCSTERKFDVRAYRAPRLRSQIEFLKKGYGPGEEVTAVVESKRAEGGIPVDAKVNISADIDGRSAFNGTTKMDANGRATAKFKLPAKLERGEGTLVFVIEDGGVVESASKTIPILLNIVDVNVYPESGDLVGGLTSRVYIEARNSAKDPADISGFVIDSKKKHVVAFATEHEGRGRFEFTPKEGEQYSLLITKPAGIDNLVALPPAKKEGAVLLSCKDQYAAGSEISLAVTSSKAEKLRVVLALRDKELASKELDVKANKSKEISLKPEGNAAGVLRATVYSSDGKPLCERLVYLAPDKKMNLKIEKDKTNPVPADEIKLTVTATDEKGQPVKDALVGITVTDDTVLEMIEKRKQSPRLPVMVFIEPEVSELADAHVYLDANNPKAPVALDLLLGTQGWRRFVCEKDNSKAFMEKYQDAAKRVLAFKDAPKPMPPGLMGVAMKREGRVMVMEADKAAMPQAAAVGGGKGRAVPAMAPRVADEKPKAKLQGDLAKNEIRMDMQRGLEPAKKPALRMREKQFQEAEMDDERDIKADRDIRFNPFVYVREYAHRSVAGRGPNDRNDFTETVYWSSGIKTGQDGKATVTFNLNDSVTTFKVMADAFSTTGALGSETSNIESVKAFYTEVKLPLEVSANDYIDLPVALVSNVPEALKSEFSFEIGKGLREDKQGVEKIDLKGNERARYIKRLLVGNINGSRDVKVFAKAGAFEDNLTRTLSIKPLGFPFVETSSGMISANQSVKFTVNIPEKVEQASIVFNGEVYPTPLGNLTSALKRLINEPGGCFEQTSSTNYPMVMAQQYFTTHTGVDPAIVKDCRDRLDRGYKRLIGFECKQKGYEWFGGDPGHEALTAYGLMEFNDMAKIQEVDKDMIKRTRDWLMAKRDGKGGFARNARALDSFGGAPPETTNAYIAWTLVESGEQGIEKEIAAVKKIAESTKDTYVIALAANVLAKSGDKEGAATLMKKLAENQHKDGYLQNAVTSITRSGGEALNIETTALALCAWMNDRNYSANTIKGMKWLIAQCESGRFGSTQSTILALRAIVKYDTLNAVPKAEGSLVISVDGVDQPAVKFTKDSAGSLVLPDIAELLAPGKHEITLKMVNGSEMPYSLVVNYNAIVPPAADNCALRLSTKLTKEQAKEGEGVEAEVSVKNVIDKDLPMVIAIVGLPGGVEPRHEHLKELVKKGVCDAYEVMGRDVVFYWRGMKAKGEHKFSVSLTAAVPGSYTGPASRTYLYYTDEYKHWIDPLKINIIAK